MTFDVVIGNPPYNRGADLDFMELGHRISNICSSMITPAKWQTADESHVVASVYATYGSVRQNVVPYMKFVKFYPDCSEIFEIRNIDGLTYYLADKQKHSKTRVVNHSIHQKYFNGEVSRSILNRESLVNVGQEIVNYIKENNDVKPYTFEPIHKEHKYGVYIASQLTCGNGWGYTNREDPCGTIGRDGKLYVLGLAEIVDMQDPVDSIRTRGAESLIFTSNSYEHCENYLSWINSKVVRFCLAINISKLNNVMTDDCFRLVPSPFIRDNKYDWNIRYTDEMLYKHFKLTDNYIDVIESLIKDR